MVGAKPHNNVNTNTNTNTNKHIMRFATCMKSKLDKNERMLGPPGPLKNGLKKKRPKTPQTAEEIPPSPRLVLTSPLMKVLSLRTNARSARVKVRVTRESRSKTL